MQGDQTTARREFARAATQLNDGHQNVSGWLALAALTFGNANYAEALAL